MPDFSRSPLPAASTTAASDRVERLGVVATCVLRASLFVGGLGRLESWSHTAATRGGDPSRRESSMGKDTRG
jgi:hypothetical protein